LAAALSELLLFLLSERHLGQKSREAVGRMATAMPVSPVALSTDGTGPVLTVTLTAPVSGPARSAIITGRELRFVRPPEQDDAVRFARVPVDTTATASLASHLELRVPLISAVRPGSPRAVGPSHCNCWQSLRLLGSTPRHDDDLLTGSSPSRGCPACGRGVPVGPGL
jgi:hypothetical protein